MEHSRVRQYASWRKALETQLRTTSTYRAPTIDCSRLRNVITVALRSLVMSFNSRTYAFTLAIMSKTSSPGHGSDTAERLRSQRRLLDQTRNIIHALLSTTQSLDLLERARVLLKEAYPRVSVHELLFTSLALDALNRASVLFTEAYRGETVHTLMFTSRALDILERTRIFLAEAYQRETGPQTLPTPPGQTTQQDRFREEHLGEMRCTFV